MTTHLSGLLMVIDLKVRQLGYVEFSDYNTQIKEPRLTAWAIAAILRDNPNSKIHTALSRKPPERHWQILKAHLPDKALEALDAKLTDQLKSQGTSIGA